MFHLFKGSRQFSMALRLFEKKKRRTGATDRVLPIESFDDSLELDHVYLNAGDGFLELDAVLVIAALLNRFGGYSAGFENLADGHLAMHHLFVIIGAARDQLSLRA
jgi:hypothetical protein